MFCTCVMCLSMLARLLVCVSSHRRYAPGRPSAGAPVTAAGSSRSSTTAGGDRSRAGARGNEHLASAQDGAVCRGGGRVPACRPAPGRVEPVLGCRFFCMRMCQVRCPSRFAHARSHFFPRLPCFTLVKRKAPRSPHSVPGGRAFAGVFCHMHFAFIDAILWMSTSLGGLGGRGCVDSSPMKPHSNHDAMQQISGTMPVRFICILSAYASCRQALAALRTMSTGAQRAARRSSLVLAVGLLAGRPCSSFRFGALSTMTDQVSFRHDVRRSMSTLRAQGHGNVNGWTGLWPTTLWPASSRTPHMGSA